MKSVRALVILFTLAFFLAAGDTDSKAGDFDSNRYSSKPLAEDALRPKSATFIDPAAGDFSRSLARFDRSLEHAFANAFGNRSVDYSTQIHMASNYEWTLIGRPSLSLFQNENAVYQLKGMEADYKIGHISLMTLLSPVTTSESSFVWGAGPVITRPAEAEDEYEQAAWQVGPAVAGFYLGNHWILGMVSQHQWSVPAYSNFNASQTIIEYFFEYDMSDRLEIGVAHYVLLNWNMERGYASPFPFDLDAARTFGVGKLPVKFSLDGFFEVSVNWKF